MVKLTIDHKTMVEQDGISIMEAAASIGITIPAMCFRPEISNHPSCMVCLVKDLDRGTYVPSCSMPVSAGMNIQTDSTEVKEARREALELLLSDHAGDCEAPCRLSCPAFMDISLMNRLIASGDFVQALHIVRQEIALPLVLGYICPAPCEKACKRKVIDQAVSICLLKRAAAQHEQGKDNVLPVPPAKSGKRVAIIGSGPAGLSAAFHLLRSGHACVLFDQHDKAGGAMQYDIPDDHLPKEMLDKEIGIIQQMGAEFRLGSRITGEAFQQIILKQYDAVILATGSLPSDSADKLGIQPDEHGKYVNKATLETNVPGVFACGNIIREQKMAVHSVAQGKMAAQQVCRHLAASAPASTPAWFNFSIGPLFEPEWKEYLQDSIPDPRINPVSGTLAGFTTDEAIHEAKRCMHCDCRKPVSCKLREYAAEYHARAKRFAGPERKLMTRSMQHELAVYETEKCIRCGLCVEITQVHGESIGLAYAGRGFDIRISVPFSGTIKEALTKTAMECVQTCPTGALSYKNQEERNPG